MTTAGAPARTVAPGDVPGGWLLAAVLALPLAGLAVLVAAPTLDVMWEQHPAHFWLVLGAGALNAGLAAATSAAAFRRGDARVFLVSLAFLSAAGFLGLHALATPGVLLDTTNAGFALATPFGLLVASGFAAASSLGGLEVHTPAIVGRGRLLRALVLGLMAVWAVLSLTRTAPFDSTAAPERASGALIVPAVVGITFYAVAVVRYLELFRVRRAPMLLGMAAAFALLGEAMGAVAFGRNWHATWWEWHVLMLLAFGLVARSAQRQWHEERFSDLYLDVTAAGSREISVLFADLQGFTSYSETHAPREVTAMLNAYFEQAIPPIVRECGGDIDRIIGDALMATFNRRGDQHDHPLRAARAALAIQRSTGELAAQHPDWPRFRVGVNTGEALVGVLGAAGGRTHTAIGDTVNLASRLEGTAPVGGVVLGPETARRIQGAVTEPMGTVTVKGKSEPVEPRLLVSLPT
ncbi:MAG: adenylate cyclase [Solirubrobacteraceae bacterium]|jgi:class 3 adenylate cyclase|nr:adenylate cyclase [Solirubrobacteraceae bacterium]